MTVRVRLYSQDLSLQLLISSALGKEFQLALESVEDRTNRRLSPADCDAIILDLNPSDDSLQDRIECYRRLIVSQVPTIVLASDRLQSAAVELVRLGAYGYCGRPPSIPDLRVMLRQAQEDSSPKEQRPSRQHELEVASKCDGMIGSGPQMQQVYDLVHRVTNINASVLVTGESGTGKELVARAIHNLGVRSKRPFVAVSCGAIPDTLIEAELFGHEKGAYTGTVGSREGYFEQARDGTLFLDEIGDLSPQTQVKLLRVLQESEFTRLGSTRLIPLRARTIFATHQNLSELVARGQFRQDLFFRINVMRIYAPPLRERPEDIPQIAMHFLDRYSHMYEKPMDRIEPDALGLLQDYEWPGNVRELENVIQSAIILTRENSIHVEDLPLSIRGDNVIGFSSPSPAGSFEQRIRDYKIRLATTAVRENNGNKTLAARSLNISRAYLHRLIRFDEPDPPLMEEWKTA